MLMQAVAKVHQRGRMKHVVPQLTIQGEIPARMVAEHLDGQPVWHPVEVLQEAHPQQQHRLDGGASIIQTVAPLQNGARRRQARINQLAEEAVTIGWREELARERRRGEQL